MDPKVLLETAEMVRRLRDESTEWWFAGLEDWSTAAIFQKLRELGVDTDAERFHQQATDAGDYEPLYEPWIGQLLPEFRGGRWEDFPYFAVQQLWPRLTPDVVCPDLIEQRLYEAENAEEEDEPLPDVDGKPALLVAGMDLVRFVQAASPGDRAARFAAVNKKGGYYDYVWCLSELAEDSFEAYPAEAGQLADMLCECVKPDDSSQVSLALALARLGRRDEASRRLEAGLRSGPNLIWVQVRAGVAYLEFGNLDAAIRCWTRALELKPGHAEWKDVTARIEKALTAAGRAGEAAAILRTHPTPPSKARVEFDDEDDSGEGDFDDADDAAGQGPYLPPLVPDWEEPIPVAPLKAAPKVGRNDPCPCGSGKKYKKCCMR